MDINRLAIFWAVYLARANYLVLAKYLVKLCDASHGAQNTKIFL